MLLESYGKAQNIGEILILRLDTGWSRRGIARAGITVDVPRTRHNAYFCSPIIKLPFLGSQSFAITLPGGEDRRLKFILFGRSALTEYQNEVPFAASDAPTAHRSFQNRSQSDCIERIRNVIVGA